VSGKSTAKRWPTFGNDKPRWPTFGNDKPQSFYIPNSTAIAMTYTVFYVLWFAISILNLDLLIINKC